MNKLNYNWLKLKLKLNIHLNFISHSHEKTLSTNLFLSFKYHFVAFFLNWWWWVIELIGRIHVCNVMKCREWIITFEVLTNLIY